MEPERGGMRRVGRAAPILIASLGLIASCATTPTSKLYHTEGTPPGTLRLGQVVNVASRDQIVTLPDLDPSHKALLASGIADAELRDGSLREMPA